MFQRNSQTKRGSLAAAWPNEAFIDIHVPDEVQYLQKISDDLKFGQKNVREFYRPRFLSVRNNYQQFKTLSSSKALSFLSGVNSS